MPRPPGGSSRSSASDAARGHARPEPDAPNEVVVDRPPGDEQLPGEEERHRARGPRPRGRHLRRDPARPGEAEREVDARRIVAARIAPARAGEQPPQLVRALRSWPPRSRPRRASRARTGRGAPRPRSRRVGPRCSRARTTTRAAGARLPHRAVARPRAGGPAGPATPRPRAARPRGSGRADPGTPVTEQEPDRALE